MTQIASSFGRTIGYLRISVTTRCNLRCVYCRPSDLSFEERRDQFLDFDEMLRVVRVLAGAGLYKVRITGGEPLVRSGVVEFIGEVAQVPGIRDLALSTNGLLLKKHAEALARNGLHRVNVSLDTLDPDIFSLMTGGGRLQDVLEGIDAAQEAGLVPIKLNVVVTRGFNDDQVAQLAALTLTRPWHVRFIEYMPIGGDEHLYQQRFVPASEVKQQLIQSFGALEELEWSGISASRNFRLPGAKGIIGFITPMTEHFCAGCNRLRLTADGKVRPCLLTEIETDILGPLRAGISDEELLQLLRVASQFKPEHHEALGAWRGQRNMVQIGG